MSSTQKTNTADQRHIPAETPDRAQVLPPMYGAPAEWYAPEVTNDGGADLTITHTHEDGTRFDGGHRGDGTLEILQGHRFIWRREPGVHIPHSRDRFADLATIRKAADALRAAGHTVAVEVDDVWRPAGEREEHRARRAEYREARLEGRAGRQHAISDEKRAAEQRIGDGMPFGEPIKVGHHSERRHRAAFERMDNYRRAAMDAYDYARSLANRASAAARNEAAKHYPRAIMRRVETMEADARRWERQLAEMAAAERVTQRAETMTPEQRERWAAQLAELARRPDLAWVRRCTLELEKVREDIAYQRAKLAALANDGVFVAWSAEHFQRDDWANVGGRWCQVARVNAKSLSVRARFDWQTSEHTERATWDEVHGRRRDGMQWDTPNGEPWPVTDAVQVAKWRNAVRRAAVNGDRYDTDAIAYRADVAHAQRLALGLPAKATDQEVAAFPEPDTTEAQRVRALVCWAAFERLQAGETVDQVAATMPAYTGPEPAWRMPTGDTVDKLSRDLVAGDVIAGVYDSFAGGRRLVSSIVGPVAVPPVYYDRRESGEWYTVTVLGGEKHEVRSHRWFAVHPAVPVEPPTHATDQTPDPWGPVLEMLAV